VDLSAIEVPGEKVGHDTALFRRGSALSFSASEPAEAVASTLQLPPGTWPTLLDGLCARFPRIDREQWVDRFARGRAGHRDGAGSEGDLQTAIGVAPVRGERSAGDVDEEGPGIEQPS
jgi:hypothetical protein